MTDQEFHKQYPDEFEEARLMAHGAIPGWCYGKGETPPMLTETLMQAYEAAFAVAFNAGFAAARKAAV